MNGLTTMSNHATMRAQQRGMPIALVELVLENHDREAPIGDDCRVLRVSRAAAKDFARESKDRQAAERMSGVAVIWSDRHGRVVTVLHDNGNRAARRYRVGG